MSTFIRIAWRNVVRNPARSFITAGAVAFGLGALIFLKSFVTGCDHQMISNYTDLLIGHIQIHRRGFEKNMSLEKSIKNPYKLARQLMSVPYIKAWAPRVKDFALVSSPQGSAGVMLLGIDPVNENYLTTLHKRVRAGSFLKKGDDDKVVIGRQLAENLAVIPGDKVVVMGQGADGSLAAGAFTVAGLLEAGGEEIDKGLAIVTLRAAQQLLVLDQQVSEIVVKATSLEDVEDATTMLRDKIDTKNFEVLSWKDISPMTYQWMQFDQVFTGLILVIVLLIVSTGVLNTILMSILERKREFGIMAALGTKPDQIIFVVAVESFILGLIGAVTGGAAGVGLSYFFSRRGIDLSMLSDALNSFYIGSVIRPKLEPASVGLYICVVLLVCLVVSMIPARRAAQLKPVDALAG
ncbi:MAG: ABC transporter permease [Deltaproteobacteria bacterium]